ncbi:ribosomal protein S18-alanine N-acetyltransferase [Marinobacter zhejiangensis]|uniref:[Ribosomal protein bS18]-alanine N-acetyltransferase n=1 Tax=Marinobacter zhejiangensis TaxID=488535 RepID=A0A1I4T9V7_9GAMM|nr:ribosomal protein S18-alanine N-acetyltransferase [Marinobacter zhejiangensis]SFM73391.1 ribosomal-protein-alanine N-acetyltransferase [Marinobacter zhejiangensis]
MSARAYRRTLEAGLIIRPLTERDLDAVIEIECLSYSHPWNEGVFQDCFHSNYRLWALEEGGELNGYAIVSYQFDEAHLLNLCVSPVNTGRGLGRRLLRHVLATSAGDGMVAVILEVRESNQPAAALYLGEGFREIGRRPGYYPSAAGREDARVMSLSLTQS